MPDRGRPPQIAPGAAQRPAELSTRPDVCPPSSRPVCARSRAPWARLRRSGYAHRMCHTAHNAPKRRYERLLYSAYIRQGKRVSARPAPVWRVLQCRARCALSQDVQPPAEDQPGGSKGTRPEAGHISAAFPSGFSIRFSSRIFLARDQPICAHSRWHSRLP